MKSVLKLRISKLCFCLAHPSCWAGLIRGVAPSVEHQDVLLDIDADLLIDVGANRGQFSLMARTIHPELTIHAFEPLPSEAIVYRRLIGSKTGVNLHEFALGETEGSAELHVSARADSSSLLSIGELQTRLFPSTSEVGRCTVWVKPLDTLSEYWMGASRAFLKLDVQGFELSVLRGARNALRHCAYVYVECSHVPLYSGQALFHDVKTYLAENGFDVNSRHNEQWMDGQLIQADYLFSRSSAEIKRRS